jgi:hypothetical protein
MINMAKRGKRESIDVTPDVGAAMMLWYSEAIREYPEGLVTQAQAAAMLNISRVAAGRLVSRGYLRAVYFPKPPDISGIAVGDDDPAWLKLVGRLSNLLGDPYTFAFPQACYVSFGDVLKLWESGEAKKKCKVDWEEKMAYKLSKGSKQGMKDKHLKLLEIHREYQRQAQLERDMEAKQKEQEKGSHEKDT